MESSTPYVVLHGDDEIPEVRAVLEDLGIDYEVSSKGEDLVLPSHLLISSGSRAVEAYKRGKRRHHFLHVVVIDRASRSLHKMLERHGCDMVAKRPIHPTVLRLIVQRALYLGSEKRELSRVAIGAKIKYKHSSGLMSKNGVLSELSLRGCGLITKQALSVGEEVKVVVPSGITEGPTLTLTGKVAGSVTRLVIEDGQSSAAVVFKGVNGATRKRIGKIMAANGMGPTGVLALPPGTPIGRQRSLETPEPRQQQAVTKPSNEPTVASGAERRTTERGAYPQSVVGRSSGSTHSLIGRDLSVGGMRVAPEPGLEVGARLRLAVYGTAGVRPVIVSAEVVRDDDENGLGLSFAPLPEAAKRRLQQIVDGLDDLCEQSGSAGVLISEVLTTE